MHYATPRRLVAGLALALTLAACGGGGGGGGGSAAVGQPSSSDPAATVNSFFATLQAGAFDKLPTLACAAQKDSIATAFNPAANLGTALSALGSVNANDMMSAVKIAIADQNIGAASVSGDKATVHVKATLNATIDTAKLKDVMKKAMNGAVPDSVIDQALASVPSTTQSTPIDDDMTLVKENGNWLMCQ